MSRHVTEFRFSFVRLICREITLYQQKRRFDVYYIMHARQTTFRVHSMPVKHSLLGRLNLSPTSAIQFTFSACEDVTMEKMETVKLGVALVSIVGCFRE